MPSELKATQETELKTADELAAIRERSGFAPVTNRAFLRITGADAARWLNGMVTNSIQTLGPGEGCYNFLLNAQGRIQGDCTVYREAAEGTEEFLLATTGAQVEAIQQHLDRFIIMDDVEMTVAYADEAGLLVLGKEAPKQMGALGLPALDPLRLVHADTEHGPVLLLTPLSSSVPRFEVRGKAATIDGLRRVLSVPGVSGESLECLRLLEGTPIFGRDIRDRDLPQETAPPGVQSPALHFAKGCYLGQEIVERIRSRGQVHRQLTQFRLTGELPSSLPMPLEAGGKPAGELTSAGIVPLPEGPRMLALGYARREAIEAFKAGGQTIAYTGGVAIPHPSILKS